MIRIRTELMIGPDLMNGKCVRRLEVNSNRIIQEGRFDDLVFDVTVKAGLIVLIGLNMTKAPAAVRMTGCQGVNKDPGGNT
jgi:hypothetical protein